MRTRGVRHRRRCTQDRDYPSVTGERNRLPLDPVTFVPPRVVTPGHRFQGTGSFVFPETTDVFRCRKVGSYDVDENPSRVGVSSEVRLPVSTLRPGKPRITGILISLWGDDDRYSTHRNPSIHWSYFESKDQTF